MTKYILHGGANKYDTDDNKNFFREIVTSLSDSAIILVVCYMMEGKNWNEVLEIDKKIFANVAPEKNLNLILANEETSTFLNQIKKADAIYMHGGNTHILKEYLDKIPDLENIWKDKVIAGTSAGALVLGKYYYENDDSTYNIGLGIFPFKLFCHYDDTKSDKLEKLKSFGENIEVCTIAEQKFFIIER